MRKCKTCGLPLWIAWLIMTWPPWKRRVMDFKDAYDCTHALPADEWGRIVDKWPPYTDFQ